MKLSSRLQKVSEFIYDGDHIIDVGCDHALLDIYLLRYRKNISAIASDIKKGPLEQARQNIEKYHLEDKIRIKLGDGLDPIEQDIDTIVISGMGGKTMVGIFKYCKEKLDNINHIVLSPNNDVYLIRDFLVKQGFYLVREELVRDGKYIYFVLGFQKGKRKYTKNEIYFGPLLLKNKSDLFKSYYQRELERKQILLKLLPKNHLVKRFELKREIHTIENICL